MSQIEFKQNSHLHPALSDPATRILKAERLLGRWANTNQETRGIAECIIEQHDDNISCRIVGVGEEDLIDWPKTDAKALANLEEEAGQRTMALAATFDLGFMKAETHIRVNKGVLVIVLFVKFLDDSGRSNYLNREFFHRRD